MNYSNKQNGSALVVFIIVVGVLILGGLGYVAWKNFIYKEPVAPEVGKTEQVTNNEEVQAAEKNAVYTNDELSFEYPASGWKEVDTIEGAGEIARFATDDYVPSVGMGLDSGASFTVYPTFQQEVPMAHGIYDVKEITVDGNQGYSYYIEYEGYRLQAFFTVKNSDAEKNYGITMQTTSKPSAEEKEAFALVLATLDIK